MPAGRRHRMAEFPESQRKVALRGNASRRLVDAIGPNNADARRRLRSSARIASMARSSESIARVWLRCCTIQKLFQQ
jgi:hypothetical protein